MSGSETTWVVGHGSLMTAAGLGKQAPGVRDLRRAAVAGRRAFAKPVKRGGCLAMDLVHAHDALLHARALGPSDPCSAGDFGALLIEVEAAAWPGLVVREGYGAESWAALTDVARARGLGVAALLRAIAGDAGDDRVAYRRALRALSGPPTTFRECHYLPHPVAVEGLEADAVCFVSPRPGETGDPDQPAIKARFPNLAPVAIAGAFPPPSYPEFREADQRRYVGLCLLAAAHGIAVDDLLGGPLPPQVALPTPAELDAERAALAELLGGADGYAARFPATREEAWALSGLGG